MPFHHVGSLKYFSFESFSDRAVTQAIFSRHGGVSPEPWSALNLGGTVGDDPIRVAENRQRAFQAVGVDPASIYDVWQVHSAEVVATAAPRPHTQPHLQADAIITDTPGVSLFMRFADCVPIMLFDPHRRAIGLVHAGWKGVVNRVVQRAVECMQDKYLSNPEEILAALGPSIASHHYQVGPEVVDQIREVFGEDASGMLQPTGDGNGRALLDLWQANRLILEQAGVRQVEVSGICTACDVQDWYSHRREHGRTGRFGAIIELRS